MARTRQFYVDNINRTDVVPFLGTAKQLQRTIAVSGSVRTPAAITIEHETTALGDVLAYFWPNTVSGYSPALRQRRVSGGTVTTASTISGGVEDIHTPAVFDVPLAQTPSGMALLMGRLSYTPPTTVTYTAQVRINGVNVGAATTGSRLLSTGGTTANEAIGRLNLPPVAVSPSSSGVVRITLSASATCTLDEAWLFSDIGQLVAVNCGGNGTPPSSGGPANRVFIEPPTPSRPRPTIRIGHAADGSDSFHPSSLDAWQFPEFTPPEVNVLTASSDADNVAVTLRHRPRWHTQAAS